MSSQTELIVTNATTESVTVWLTLGATAGCISNVSDVGWGITAEAPLQGYFTLQPGTANSVSYISPQGVGFNGNITFGTPPLNCATPSWPEGVNIAEFILNNAFQGSNAMETVDISAVAGVNAMIAFHLHGGGSWSASSAYPKVTSFSNSAIGDNVGRVGVYPYGCDDCTASVAPPACANPPKNAPNPIVPQTDPICNVQRDASKSGGMVSITFLGYGPGVLS
ncbi:hypothetical protein [Ancylobacter sp. SL191]|uniref:hypothetical protein n=1 Tax=Ancylobacter sp. SL191 TaxID=2995166 RepID=UPI00227133D5|nr:hypothetical protein [Ancylobacter sp. SL191]WAC27340.1 hypothetical protein OU996_20475 [Ancylobacter sp. SL191]